VSISLKGRAGKLAYAVGAIGDTGFYQIIMMWLLPFLIGKELLHLDYWLACIAIGLSFGVWNAINDPILGAMSDRTRTKIGRRKPFIAIGAPLTILFLVLLFTPPTGGKPLTQPFDLGIFLYILVVLGFWAWTYTMAAVTWFALYPEIWESVKDRSEVVMYRQIFAIIGGALAVAAFPILVDSLSKTEGDFNGWILAAAILGTIFAGAYLFSIVGVKERKEFVVDKSLSMGKSIAITFKNKTLRTYVIMDLMTWCMTGWLSATMPFFATECLGIKETDAFMLMAPSMLGILAFFMVWRKIYMRFGPKISLAAATIGFTFAFIPCLFVQTVLQGALWALSVGATMSGILLSREIMMGDVVDEDEIKTGLRREGSYFGAFGAIEKISFLIIPMSIAVIFQFVGYGSSNPNHELINIGFRIGIVTCTSIFSIIMLIFLRMYPLGKDKASRISQEIQRLHAEKTKKMTSSQNESI
jgi:GPH family glycoside/pentoside/hexuronide:cation symporter